MPVTVEAHSEERLPGPVESAAYFVVSEALANVAKYARATHATVMVERANGHVTIEVADDGVGGADAGNGSGLRGLEDRLAALDGTLWLESPVGQGTRLRAQDPGGLAAAAAQDGVEPLRLVGGVVFEALVGDAEGREPGVEEVGVAVAVLFEGSGGGVELAAVEFDDEVVFSVDGVDFVAGYLLVELGERQAVAFEEADEAVLEVGAGGACSGVSCEVRRPGYRVRRVVSSAGVVSRWTWASLRARVSCLGFRTSARSTSVRAGVVTGMP